MNPSSKDGQTLAIKKRPLASVIVPVRNEARYIRKCLDSLAAQDYPKDSLEVLAIEARSKDDTSEILSSYQKNYPFLRVLHNPEGSTPTSLNRGIKESKGDVIIVLSAHSRVTPTFVSQSVEFLERTGDDCVGGTMEATGENYLGKGIALVLSSPFGVGGARFRYSRKARHVDTVAYGAYRREVFDKIGLFDERLERNQDIELNHRLRRSGGKIFLTPAIKSYYYGPQTLRTFLRQAYNNGFWNIKTIPFAGLVLSYRHFVPLAFLLLLLATGILSIFSIAGRYLLISFIFVYGLADLVSSAILAFDRGMKFLPLLPLLFPGLHVSYGLGSFVALFSSLKEQS